MHEIEAKEYQIPRGEIDRKEDPVPDKKARKFVAVYVVKKASTV